MRFATILLSMSLLILVLPDGQGQEKKDADNKEAGAIVNSYIEANSLEKRLAFVLNPDRIQPLMKERYKDATTFGAKPTILSVIADPKIAELFFVTAESTFGSPPRKYENIYVTKKTKDGFKLDWEASVGYNPIPLSVLFDKFPSKAVKARVEGKKGIDWLLDYRKSTKSHHSFNLWEEQPKKTFVGFIEKKSEDGKRLGDLMNDGKTHRIIIEFDPTGPQGEALDARHGNVRITRFVSDSWYDPEAK